MKPSEYIQLVKAQLPVDADKAKLLEEIIEEYPYFQSASALYLKFLYDSGSYKYNSKLKLTAAHTIDRTVLFNYITSSYFNQIEEIKPIWVEQPQREEPQEVETTTYIKDIVIEGVDVLETESSIELQIEEPFVEKLSDPEIQEELLEEEVCNYDDVEEIIVDSEQEALTQETFNEIDVEEILTEETLLEEVMSTEEDVLENEIEEETVVEELTDVENQEQLLEEVLEVIFDVDQVISEIEEEQQSESVEEEVPDSIAAYFAQQKEEDFIEGEEVLENLEKEKELEPEEKTELVVTPEEKLAIGKPLVFSKTEKHSFQEWLQLTQFKPIDRREPTAFEEEEINDDIEVVVPLENPPLGKKIDLIDRFIETNPRIPRATEYESTTKIKAGSIERTENTTTLMTETLAKVYLEQKKYDRAIQAYEILILKNPEKSSLFADRIEDIKQLKQNN